MGNIKEIKVGGVCTCCSAPKELKELILRDTNSSYVRVVIGDEEVDVSAFALIKAIQTLID